MENYTAHPQGDNCTACRNLSPCAGCPHDPIVPAGVRAGRPQVADAERGKLHHADPIPACRPNPGLCRYPPGRWGHRYAPEAFPSPVAPRRGPASEAPPHDPQRLYCPPPHQTRQPLQEQPCLAEAADAPYPIDQDIPWSRMPCGRCGRSRAGQPELQPRRGHRLHRAEVGGPGSSPHPARRRCTTPRANTSSPRQPSPATACRPPPTAPADPP